MPARRSGECININSRIPLLKDFLSGPIRYSPDRDG